MTHPAEPYLLAAVAEGQLGVVATYYNREYMRETHERQRFVVLATPDEEFRQQKACIAVMGIDLELGAKFCLETPPPHPFANPAAGY